MRTMKDSDEDQIHQFLACNPRWNPAAAYPRAHQIYQERLAEAKSGLNMDLIQGNVTLSICWMFSSGSKPLFSLRNTVWMKSCVNWIATASCKARLYAYHRQSESSSINPTRK
jgi:hypothetical protein